jgi:hypothetical protein
VKIYSLGRRATRESAKRAHLISRDHLSYLTTTATPHSSAWSAAVPMADTYKEYLAARVLNDNRPVSSLLRIN